MGTHHWPRRTIASHVMWVITCTLLVAVIGGLLATNSRLQAENTTLRKSISLTKQAKCISRDPWAAGTTHEFSVESEGQQRGYLVHLPTDFRPDKTYPAVIYISGKAKGAHDSELYSSYNDLPAIAIYPEPTMGKDGVVSWQGAPYSSGADDVKFIGRMLDQITGQLCIERTQVYAVGISNGGGLVALLSCKMPDRIRAFGIVAGAFYPESACTPQKPAPIISIHGDSDHIVPYFGSVARNLPDIDVWASHRARQNICKAHPFITHQPSAIITTWQDCPGDVTVRSIRQIGVGHAWTPADRDIIWQFFSRY